MTGTLDGALSRHAAQRISQTNSYGDMTSGLHRITLTGEGGRP